MRGSGLRRRRPFTGEWLIVCRREMLVKLTDRAYLLSTAISILLIIASTLGSAYLLTDRAPLRIVTADPAASELAEDVARFAADQRGGAGTRVVEATNVAKMDEAEQRLREQSADILLRTIGDPSTRTGWELVSAKSIDPDAIGLVEDVLRIREIGRLAANAHEDPGTVAQAMSVRTSSLNPSAEHGFYLWIIGLAFSVLFYFSSMTYGVQIAQSVLEEKQSRIVEIIVASIPIRQLLIGKVVGNSLIAILQMLVLTGCGFICGLFTPARQVMPAAGSAAGWFILMFFGGFIALAGIWAAAGSLCTRSEDLQYTAQPIMFVLSGVFIVGATVHGAARVVMSYVPLFSTILMPIRLMEGEVGVWELAAAFVLAIACGGVMIIVGDRIYRRALLRTDRRLGYREALASSVDVL